MDKRLNPKRTLPEIDLIKVSSGPLLFEISNIFLNLSKEGNLFAGEYSPKIPHNVIIYPVEYFVN